MNISEGFNYQCLTLAILSGGSSKRMGCNKALLPFNQKTLIEHIVNRGRALTDDLLITTNQINTFRFLNLPLFLDRLPERGKIIGLDNAFSASSRPLVAVIGCDMPFFNPQLLIYQAKLLIKNGVDAVVPRTRDGLEPLHAVYRRETCLATIQKSLEMNKFSLIDWLQLQRVLEITEEQIAHFDPDFKAFINLNTPEEYQSALNMLISDK